MPKYRVVEGSIKNAHVGDVVEMSEEEFLSLETKALEPVASTQTESVKSEAEVTPKPKRSPLFAGKKGRESK